MSKKHEKQAKREHKRDSSSADSRSPTHDSEQRLAELKDALQKARAEKEELRDKLLRAYAELENVRKRSLREIEEAEKYAISKFAAAIIEVVDNLERALAVDKSSEEDLRKGVQMTLDAWHKTIRKFGLERVDALGRPFDPNVHEAMVHIPHEADPGQVVAQHVTGYTLHGRLLRPARVVVSSGPPRDTAAGTSDKGQEKEEKAGT